MNILITRPEPKATELKNLLSKLNHHVEQIPLLAIKPRPPALWQAELTLIPQPNALIFVSMNAVKYFTEQTPPASYLNLPVFAPGQSTANLLKAQGFKYVYCPSNENSEGILSLPQLQLVQQQNILIICGSQGRELLAQTLETRGAHIYNLIVYESDRRKLNEQELNLLHQDYDLVIISSTEALRYWLALCPTSPAIHTVMTGQMQQLANSSGAKTLLLHSLSNKNILAQIKKL